MNKPNKIKIIIADDHGIMRDGLSYLIKKHPDMEIVCQASNGKEAVTLSDSHDYDVMLMDIHMPDVDGIDAARNIKKSKPQTKILVFSSDMTLSTTRRALDVEVDGIVLKEALFVELAEAIRNVNLGRKHYCKNVKKMISDYCLTDKKLKTSEQYSLSNSDYELIKLLSEGKNVNEIADILSKSPKTIDARRRQVMNKLGLDSIAQLTKFAIKHGLTNL